MDEEQAIRKLKQGDVGGLEFLVQCHQVKALRAAYLITRDLGLAEDVVQDSFIRAYHAIRGFDGTRPFEPWFLRIVVNAAVKMMQKSARQIQIGNDVDETVLRVLATSAEPIEAKVESIEVQQRIWNAMQKLSPRQRAVIVQRYFLEMSEKEMAEVAGTAAGTVKWLLNAARERLRRILERSEK